jgi:hypothetical protein
MCLDYTHRVFAGTIYSCGNYACDAVPGVCFNFCESSLDCAPGLSCDFGDHTCKQ